MTALLVLWLNNAAIAYLKTIFVNINPSLVHWHTFAVGSIIYSTVNTGHNVKCKNVKCCKEKDTEAVTFLTY